MEKKSQPIGTPPPAAQMAGRFRGAPLLLLAAGFALAALIPTPGRAQAPPVPPGGSSDSGAPPAAPVDPAIAQLYNEGLEAATEANFDLAKQKFRAVLEKSPDFVPALYNLGLVHEKLGEWAEAVPRFRKVLEIEPDHRDAQRILANVLFQKGDYKEALPAYVRAIELDSTRTGLYYSKAEVLDRLAQSKEDYPGVIEAYETALRKDGNDPRAYNAAISVGTMSMKLEKPQAAFSAFRLATKINPDNAVAHYNCAIAQKALKKFDGAIQSLEKAISLKDPYGAAHFVLAGIYYQNLKNDQKALEQYDLAAADPAFGQRAKAKQYADSIRDYLEKKRLQQEANQTQEPKSP